MRCPILPCSLVGMRCTEIDSCLPSIAVGWSTSHVNQASFDPAGFSAPGQDPGVKARMVNLIGAVRMLLRGEWKRLQRQRHTAVITDTHASPVQCH